MANKVQAEKGTYDKLDTLKKLHGELLKEISDEIAQTRSFVGTEKGFYSPQVSENTKAMLDVLEQKIVKQLKENFECSEKSIKDMEAKLKEEDHI